MSEKNGFAQCVALVCSGQSCLVSGLVIRKFAFISGLLIGASILLNGLGLVFFTRMIKQKRKEKE